MTEDEGTSGKKKVAIGGSAVALIAALTGGYTAIHGTKSTTTATAVTRNDTPLVINRPRDKNGSPLPVTVITPGPNGGPPIVIVGSGAPEDCPSPTATPSPSPSPSPTASVDPDAAVFDC